MVELIFALIIAVPILIIALIAIIYFIANLCNDDSRAEMKKEWDKEKYCNYMFTCPMCNSNKVKRIGTVNRTVSVATVGLASSKIGKQYECDDCKHKW